MYFMCQKKACEISCPLLPHSISFKNIWLHNVFKNKNYCENEKGYPEGQFKLYLRGQENNVGFHKHWHHSGNRRKLFLKKSFSGSEMVRTAYWWETLFDKWVIFHLKLVLVEVNIYNLVLLSDCISHQTPFSNAFTFFSLGQFWGYVWPYVNLFIKLFLPFFDAWCNIALCLDTKKSFQVERYQIKKHCVRFHYLKNLEEMMKVQYADSYCITNQSALLFYILIEEKCVKRCE